MKSSYLQPQIISLMRKTSVKPDTFMSSIWIVNNYNRFIACIFWFSNRTWFLLLLLLLYFLSFSFSTSFCSLFFLHFSNNNCYDWRRQLRPLIYCRCCLCCYVVFTIIKLLFTFIYWLDNLLTWQSD